MKKEDKIVQNKEAKILGKRTVQKYTKPNQAHQFDMVNIRYIRKTIRKLLDEYDKKPQEFIF